MVISKEIIDSRLKRLESCQRRLGELAKQGLNEFLGDEVSIDLAERNLQIGIQCLLDIGNHIIAERGFQLPESNEDIFRILGKHGVIPKDFASKIEGMAGFRNILVHDYLEIDPKKVYQNLLNALKDFDEFARYIVGYIEGQK